MYHFRGNHTDQVIDRIVAMMAITDDPATIRDTLVEAGESDDFIFLCYVAAKRIFEITAASRAEDDVRREENRESAARGGIAKYFIEDEEQDPFSKDYSP